MVLICGRRILVSLILYLKEFWEILRNVEKYVYYISEVYDCNIYVYFCSDFIDFLFKKSFDVNIVLILYLFFVFKIMYMYRFLKMIRFYW